MVPFAAEVSAFDNPIARQLALQIGVPLLDHRIAPVVEVALPDTQAQVGAGAAVGTIEAS